MAKEETKVSKKRKGDEEKQTRWQHIQFLDLTPLFFAEIQILTAGKNEVPISIFGVGKSTFTLGNNPLLLIFYN